MVPNRAKHHVKFELKKLWLGDNYAIGAFASLRFVNGEPKGNFQLYWLSSTKLADIAK